MPVNHHPLFITIGKKRYTCRKQSNIRGRALILKRFSKNELK